MPGGRPTSGPDLVDGLEGSQEAKRKMKVFLQTLEGSKTIGEASELLEINESMVHRLRCRAIEAAIRDLEAKPIGRPRRTGGRAEQVAELEGQIAKLKSEQAVLERKLQSVELKERLFSAIPGLEGKVSKGSKKGKPLGPIR